MTKKIINLGLNRVEGDLEIKVEIDGDTISNVWSTGTMFRGIEQILKGRQAMDGLVITPRICGICGTAHSYAAVSALETAFDCPIGINGTRIRNICLMAENIQSDPRHAFLIYLIEFCNERYKDNPYYHQALEAFAPFKGRFYREAIVHTKHILEIVAIFGGQWPHSSYMLPGGVATLPSRRNLIQSLAILDNYIKWYEKSVLGCTSDEWLGLKSASDFEQWLEGKDEHRSSAVGLFSLFGRSIGLEKLGRGNGNLLSYGAYFDPKKWQPPFEERACLFESGFYNGETGEIEPFSHDHVKEHVKHSWYLDYDGGLHPWEGETIPDYQPDSEKYSWAKAPRYKGHVAEVGPVAEMVVHGDSLIQDFFKAQGSTVWLRQFTRFHRPVVTMQKMRQQLLDILAEFDDPFYIKPENTEEGEGVGMVHAARGALGHWIRIEDGQIESYQIITPTAWNASPRDSEGNHGPMEATLMGTKIADLENPLEIGHIVRSYDACLVCTVHFLKRGKKLRYGI